MDQLNYKSIAKALLKLIHDQFNEDEVEPSDEHFLIAEILLEKLHKVTHEYLFFEDNENFEGGNVEIVEFRDEETGSALQTDSIPLSKKKAIIDAIRPHKGKWKFRTIQQRFPLLKHPSYIGQWTQQIIQGGTKFDIYRQIEKNVMKKFNEARDQFLPIHDCDMQKWGKEKAAEFHGLNFKGSKTWLASIKNRNGITSRKIQKFISQRSIRNKDEIATNAQQFRNEMRPEIEKFLHSNVWNTDQCGFKYELLSTRTLSHKGERCTLGACHSPKNKATHSYTVQYIIALDGSIIGDLYICLQENANQFGPIVENNIFLAPNLIVKCSKSGKLTRNLVESFLEEVVKPKATGQILYILDKWPCQMDEELYLSRFINEEVEMIVKFIPENCTDQVQPLDTYFHRQLKYLVKKFYSYELLNETDTDILTSRNGILKLQSLVHLILSAEICKPMIKYCWFSSGLLEDRPEFKNIKELCFTFMNSKCELQNCVKNAFIKCTWCFKNVCYDEFFHEYHLMICENSPFL